MIYILITVGIVLAIIGYIIFQFHKIKNAPVAKDHPNVTSLTDNNFVNKTAKGVVLVDFWAPWCMPCKIIGPLINEIAEEFNDKATIGKLNVDENPKMAQRYGIRSIPTIILFKNGKEVERMMGMSSKMAIINALKKYF